MKVKTDSGLTVHIPPRDLWMNLRGARNQNTDDCDSTGRRIEIQIALRTAELMKRWRR